MHEYVCLKCEAKSYSAAELEALFPKLRYCDCGGKLKISEPVAEKNEIKETKIRIH